MPLFPASFVEDLKSHADIVQVVQERVQLRRSGATYKGLCPFHGEKTPSFHVYGDKGFFKCFGCGVGGDVIKFVELYDKVSFPEAVRQLAARVGLTVPEQEDARQDVENQRERESLLKVHEIAAAWFREQLHMPHGGAARRLLAERGVTSSTADQLGMGYAPPARDHLRARLLKEGFPPELLVKSGLVIDRENGTTLDRFRNRLMIPIARETGAIIAFGGRAMEEGQQPKYLNSPETPIYVKGRTLYGLHLGKSSISTARHAVMVEGYFDVAQALQAGITNVVASSGTALTPAQARLLKRFTTKVVLSFDPDAAGLGAAARTSELLVAEGFSVNVAVLPGGNDPDAFIRRHGGAAYQERLRNSRPYLDYLLDRASEGHDFTRDDSRREFLAQMLAVAARIPDAAARDQFADRLAHKARVTEEVVRAEIRKAAVQKQTSVSEIERRTRVSGAARPAEAGLIWALVHRPDAVVPLLPELDRGDLEGLATAGILEEARSLQGCPPTSLPGELIQRLNSQEVELVQEIGRHKQAPGDPAECVRALRRMRFDRERAAVQREIDRLQEEGAARYEQEILALWARKKSLLQQIEALIAP
jgi:DNA primase